MRIKVDCSDFFDDERKLSVVNVNIRDFPSVQDVIDKIIWLIKLIPTKKRKKADVSLDNKPEYGLFEEGFYIHPEDTSTVLEDIGVLKLKTLKSTEASEEKKKRKKRKSKEEEEDVVEMPRKGRKIIVEEREEEEEEEGDDGKDVEEQKTNKRSKVQEDEDVRGRKKKRKKGSDKVDAEVCMEVVEDEVDVPKKSKRQTRQSLKLDPQDSESEVIKKSEEKHQLPSESCRKKAKTLKKMKEELLSDDDSVTSTRDSRDLTRSPRFKKSKATMEDEPSPDRDITEVREKDSVKVKRKKQEGPSTENEEEKVSSAVSMRRSLRQVNEECIDKPCSSRNLKKISTEESSSQEKEVSTSFIGDDEKSESKSRDSELECESKGSESHGNSSYEADGPPLLQSEGNCRLARRRRNRKHAKLRKRKPIDVDELTSSEIPVQPDSGTCKSSSRNFRNQKDIDISTSHLCTHIIFSSDDDDSRDCEKKVTSASQTYEGNDIEVVQHISTPKISTRSRSLRKKCLTPSSDAEEVIVLEDDDSTQIDSNEIVEEKVEEELWRRYSLKHSQVRLESLSTLQQMAENGAFTIVHVTSRDETVTSKTYELPPPKPTPTLRLDPPIPLQREIVGITEETKKNFQKLLNLEKCTEPLLLQQPRISIPEVDDSENSIKEKENQAEIPDQSTSASASKQDAVGKIKSVDSCELIRIPSTSSDMESNEISQIDVPGPSRFARRSVPRAYDAVGKLLSNLMKNKDSQADGEEGLQGITSNQVEFQCAHEKSLHEEEDITSNNSNDDITSTMGDGTNCEVIIHEEEELGVDGSDDGKEDVTLVNKENVCLVEAAVEEDSVEAAEEEDSKKNILKDAKDVAIFTEEVCLQYPLMKTRPKVGEYLAIKVLSLDETLRPIFSKYFPVQVLEVSGLKVKLKKVHNLQRKKACKKIKEEDGVEEVDLTFEEEVDLTDDEALEVIELDWRDVVEPRLLYP